MALAWRKLARALRSTKQAACDRHAQQLADVFRTFAQVGGREGLVGTAPAACR